MGAQLCKHTKKYARHVLLIKICVYIQAKLMFDGEMASLDAILKTETIRVPKPVKVIGLDTGGCVFVMEHLDMKGLSK